MLRNNEHNEKFKCYFSTFETTGYVDVFIRPVYKQVVVHTLNHFIESKGLVVYCWCLMTHHLHLVAGTKNGSMTRFEHDFKSFTASKILEAIETEPPVRKNWMLERFEKLDNNGLPYYEVWQNNKEPLYVDLTKTDHLLQLFNHIHQNPVRDKIVDLPGEYLYSSARDYSGMGGIVAITRPPLIAQKLSATESMNGNFFVKYVHT